VDKLVVLKLPKKGMSIDDTRIWFETERDALKALVGQPGIVKLVAYDDHSHSFATEYVNGKSLERILNDCKVLPLAHAIRLGLSMARTLQLAHQQGWLHLDVKPGNIIVRSLNEVVVIDFGLAIKSKSEFQKRVAGTPYYIAPEVFFQSGSISEQADVFSLGATIYRMLVGKPPHFHQNLVPNQPVGSQASLDILSFRFQRTTLECDLREVCPSSPQAICRLINAALSLDPMERPEGVGEMVVVLEALLIKLDTANQLHTDLWILLDLIIEMIRQVNSDPNFASHATRNANRILRELSRATNAVPSLYVHALQEEAWQGFPKLEKVVYDVQKTLRKLESVKLQLDCVAKENQITPSNSLDFMVSRSIENLRSITIDLLRINNRLSQYLIHCGYGDSPLRRDGLQNAEPLTTRSFLSK
jgi:serine/threonine protein kinase